MPNPMWVDARDYLTSNNIPVTTNSLNQAMNVMAERPDLRPSYAKQSSSPQTAIAAGLGAPTDQIVSRPLPPPSNRSSAGGGGRGAGSGASTEGSARARPVPVPKPQTVNAEDAVGANGDPLQQLVAPPAKAPSSPVAPAAAATAPATGGTNWGALGAGALGVSGLIAALLSRGRSGAGLRASSADVMAGAKPYGTPNVMADAADMPMQKYGTPNAFPDPLAGAKPYGTPGALDAPPDPLEALLPYGTPGAMGDTAPNQSAVPYSGAAPASMPPQLASLIDELINSSPVTNRAGIPQGTPAPGSIEELISQRTNQTPPGESPAPPLPPSGPPGGPAMRSPIGTRRGTQKPYTGQAAAPSGFDALMQLLLHSGGTVNDTMGGTR